MATVNELFFSAVLTAASPETVAMPNVGFDPSGLDSYYQVFVIPGHDVAFDLTKSNTQGGFCQVSCYVRDKTGEINAVAMAKKIIAAFPRNTTIKDDDFRVELVQPAYYSQGLTTNNGWYMVPVTIPYIVHNL